jgi:restriction system protein
MSGPPFVLQLRRSTVWCRATQRQDLYDNVLYAMVLRTIHELFEADTVNALASIIFNGWVTSLDKGTGNEVSRCILTINVTRQEFLAINLANVDPRQCFKKLKGMSSAKLSDLVPVAPLLDLNREDRRFVQSYDVTGTIQEGDNLAVMHWEDFEHLIRELFEKEFGGQGGEVKVTQASRDGGVDAVIFDPDPIRGGKIVVQAKRYTNTVGVAAVRDLYGTVINEGAMKGILITTSDYGPDAFHFAKDKPLTLMNGANLLYLVEKHGKKARIDLKEAKRA